MYAGGLIVYAVESALWLRRVPDDTPGYVAAVTAIGGLAGLAVYLAAVVLELAPAPGGRRRRRDDRDLED